MSGPYIWPEVKGKPPTRSLRGQTIVFGAQANAHVHPVMAGVLNAHAAAAIPQEPWPYLGEDLVLDGDDWRHNLPGEREPTLEQEEIDSDRRAAMRGEA